jgi:hypothetical protein
MASRNLTIFYRVSSSFGTYIASSLRFSVPCALPDFLLTFFQEERQKYKLEHPIVIKPGKDYEKLPNQEVCSP